MTDQTDSCEERCRFCATKLRQSFVDLGLSPLCESFVTEQALGAHEVFYPLHAKVCDRCLLVQVGDFVPPEEIYSEYAYFSSYSDSWVAHAENYVESIVKRLGLDGNSFIVEIASNDGYLLQHFLARNLRVLGIEPAANVAAVATEKGIPTEVCFFGEATARRVLEEHGPADLIVGNNVLAHVPDINDFVAGMKLLLKENGHITMEFPHLLRLMEQNQFDTIYHEHFSYLSLYAAEQIFSRHGLVLFDVEELKTHGGSLRVYVRHAENHDGTVSDKLEQLRAMEAGAGMDSIGAYTDFAGKVEKTKNDLLAFLLEARKNGKTVAGYGAPGKGNTLLNYCGIRTDLLSYTVDRNPYKHGRYTPGMRIPIHAPEKIKETKPDFLLILPWNLKDEIVEQTAYIRSWGGQWVVPIPELTILE